MAKATDKTRVAGYCARCRAKEIEMYGAVLNDAGRQHAAAVKAAGCEHPPHYDFGSDEAVTAPKR